jgi:hypothetical protein
MKLVIDFKNRPAKHLMEASGEMLKQFYNLYKIEWVLLYDYEHFRIEAYLDKMKGMHVNKSHPEYKSMILLFREKHVPKLKDLFNRITKRHPVTIKVSESELRDSKIIVN